jgi:hypothetical protein
MQARSTTTAESVAKARPTSKFGYNPVADRIIESCTRSATDQRPRTSKMPIHRFEGQSLLFERLIGIAVLSFLFVVFSVGVTAQTPAPSLHLSDYERRPARARVSRGSSATIAAFAVD